MPQDISPITITAAAPTYGLDNDRPEDGGIKIRVTRPTGTTAGPTTSGPGTFTAPFTLTGAPAISLDHFLSYEYSESWLSPSDKWSFTLSGDEISDDQRAALVPGATVEVSIDDNTQTTGYIDTIRVKASRSGGWIITIEGRDWMAPAIDSQIDPQTRLKPGMNFIQFLGAIFLQFGMDVITDNNVANINVITGQTKFRGTPTSKKGKPLSKFLLHEEKPYPNEGAYAFASRVAQRMGEQGTGNSGGFWIRPTSTVGTLVVAKPNFDQLPLYSLHQKTDVNAQFNNVLDSEVELSREEQVSALFASGFGGGGDLPKSTLRCVVFNPSVEISPDQKAVLLAPYAAVTETVTEEVQLSFNVVTNEPDSTVVPVTRSVTTPAIQVVSDPRLDAIAIDDIVAGATFPFTDPNARPAYLYDPEAKTLDQLQAFALRELALRLRKSLTYKCTIEGHRLSGTPIAVDTIIDVDDDISNVHRPMWVLSRRFSKVPGSGTTTQLELIRPGTLIL